MDETKLLAKFLSALRFEDLPPEVVDTAKLCILDTLGAGLVATRTAWARISAEYVSDLCGAEESTVWGAGRLATAQDAAFANGTASHGFEIDDRCPSAAIHPGCIAVPAAVAVAERANRTGSELITAVVAGYELGLRVGRAVSVRFPGIHPAGHKGIWAGVGSACSALGLDAVQTLDAYGITGSMASGISEFSEDPRGTMVKRIHAGLAARNAVTAAILASKGMTGPATVLEGSSGYCNVFAAPGTEPLLNELTDELGESFRIVIREVKPYAAWGGGHRGIDAAAGLMRSGSISVDDIARVTIRGSWTLLRSHGLKNPDSIMAAQYSLPFLVATAMCRGSEVFVNPNALWTMETVKDQQIVGLLSKIDLVLDDDLTQEALAARDYGKVRIAVDLKSGQTISNEVEHSKGTANNPMTRDEIGAKFVLLARDIVSDGIARRIIEVVDDMENLENLGPLMALLRPAA